jgi:hypothetical protein
MTCKPASWQKHIFSKLIKIILIVLVKDTYIFTFNFFANAMSEAFPKTKSRYHPAYKFPIPHLRSWFARYRSHRRNNEYIKAILTAVYGAETVDSVASSFEIIMKLKRHGVSGQHPATLTPDESIQVMQSLELTRSLVDKTVKDRIAYGKFKTSCADTLAKLFAEKPLESSYFFFV